MPWQAFIEFVAAANAFMLALALMLSPRLHQARARNRLAGFLFCIGWLLTTFMLVDQQWLGVTRQLQLIDDSIALLVPALFLDYVWGALGRGPIRPWVYAPAALFFFSGLIFTDWILDTVRISHIILIYFAYTCTTTIIFLHARNAWARRPRQILYILAGTWLLHAAQFMLIFLPSVGWVFDLIPLVGAAFILGLTILVLTDSPALREYTQSIPAAKTEQSLTLEELDAFMRTEKPFRDKELKVDTLALALGISGRQLSEAINRLSGGNFYDFVNRHRVDEARELLRDPDEARTSIEVIGLLVGFRARSTFYDAFRRLTGQTPAQYRRNPDL